MIYVCREAGCSCRIGPAWHRGPDVSNDGKLQTHGDQLKLSVKMPKKTVIHLARYSVIKILELLFLNVFIGFLSKTVFINGYGVV